MKRSFILKSISGVAIAATIIASNPLGVSAQGNISTSQGNEITQTTNEVSSTNGFAKNNGRLCYKENGKVKTGWIKSRGKWYFADSKGVIQTGVIKIDGKTYYFNKSGVMQTGRVRINGTTYRFAKNGQAVGNKIPNASKEFDCNGNLISNGDNGTTETPDNNGGSNGDNGTTETPDNNGGSNGDNGTTETPDNDGGSNGDNGTTETPDNNGGSNGDNGTTETPDNNAGSNGNNGSTTPDNNQNDNGSVNVSGLPTLPTNYSTTIQSSAEQKILELMNEKRVAAGLKPLTMDNTLLDVARYKSNHMIQYNYFSHTNPDGTNWTNWLKTLGYKYTATAENIAYNSYDPVELFNQWWNSSGHRQNMMNPNYTKVGIGVLKGNGKYMGTQTFSN
ncbi:CAP domain-containing protein [Clostridium neonatale]|uniref:CAP domain-containing protein n=1 Tax=Clostridium neonatale TaxID=137838 RepID=UPI00291BEB86|nr:CAP domain-containing protein [Clostridium neonatale]CAI3197728.1 SCP-like extracellular protein [Clostridium neonatale]CAI3201597.1 SCP-like extracellular protein [Clostridium neonatale]CAI3612886.1 SCP-like extracellular protein [Clostridium neonatale]CAI3630158.1 SCP-like extracellular protein [Clostridium neonatale]CAI3670269.1 SCP-like extracellular protein [Clostridium neonatale]